MAFDTSTAAREVADAREQANNATSVPVTFLVRCAEARFVANPQIDFKFVDFSSTPTRALLVCNPRLLCSKFTYRDLPRTGKRK